MWFSTMTAGQAASTVTGGERPRARPGTRRFNHGPAPAAHHPQTYTYAGQYVYTQAMRRIQIYMDEELDDLLESDAARLGVSKASLIRDAVAQRYADRSVNDPVAALIGAYDGEAGDSVDDVVYR